MAEEETDHGELLTKFEEIFGSLVEHEVIKMVLQSCGWDSTSASEMILSMIDQEQLPPHVRHALLADTVVRGMTQRFSPPVLIDTIQDKNSDSDHIPEESLVHEGASMSPSPTHSYGHNGEQTNDISAEDFNIEGDEGLQGNALDSRSASRNDSPNLVNRNSTVPSVSASFSSVITPFAMAQSAIAKEPYLGSGTLLKSWSAASTLPLHAKDDEKEIVDALQNDGTDNRESDSSALKLPERSTAPELDFETIDAQDTSKWILAPEFVPNELHQTHGFFPQRPNHGFPCASYNPSRLSNGLQNGNTKGNKKDEIVSKILAGRKIVVLMRGLPGSGKSTLAKEIKTRAGVILSTDDFFMDKFGNYNFEPHKLREAHAWNMNRARIKIQDYKSPIIIDNTNLQVWEMMPYVKLALQHGYEVDILEPETSWKLCPRELAKRTIHNVPKTKINEMKERYDPAITIEHVIESVQDVRVQGGEKTTRDFKSDHCKAPKKAWPVTLPERKVIENGIEENLVLMGDGSAQVSKLINANNAELPSKNLQECGKAEEDDDPDVIVEGYEDSEEGDSAAGANPFSPKKQVQEGNSKTQLDLSSTNFADALCNAENYTEMQSEDGIRALIEEANMDADEFVTDWDDLAKEADEEELNEEKFNELVDTFGSSVRYELQKAKDPNESVKAIAGENLDDDDDDSAMYELCNNMEDKIGYSLSSAIIRPNISAESTSLFSIINSSEVNGDHKTASGEMAKPILVLKGIGGCQVPPENNEGEGLSIDFVKVSKSDEDLAVLHSQSLYTHNVHETSENNGVVGPPNAEECQLYDSRLSQDESSKQNDVTALELLKNEYSLLNNSLDSLETVENDKLTADVADSHNSSSDKSCESADKESHHDSCPVITDVASWECINLNGREGSVNWESPKTCNAEADGTDVPKPTRDRRRRTSGDPKKWLLQETDSTKEVAISCNWEPVKDGAVPAWDSSEANKHMVKDEPSDSDLKPKPHTGAVPKMRVGLASQSSIDKVASHSNSVSPVSSQSVSELVTDSSGARNDSKRVDGQTQTLSIDFEALELDNNLYELKILYGQPNYVPQCDSGSPMSEHGPLTKGKLMLEKGTITENIDEPNVAKPLKSLVAFFPCIPEANLQDVLEKCKYNINWAMNVLLDSGYEMAENVNACDSQEDSEVEERESNLEPLNDCNTNEKWQVAYNGDADNSPPDERSRRLKQSRLPDDLNCKREIENAFMLPENVDDRITRLTGKEFDDLNMTKIKKKKSKKKHSKKKHHDETVNWAEGEGAQYVTLVMDSLFASQLINMFGPIGSCGMSGDMVPEDRSVILPLELCLQIHKYWAHTLDGKFNHEAEVLDSLIRQDEDLARRLQEEEDLASKNQSCPTTGLLDDPEKVFQNDPPSNFKEIMDLEQALQESQGNKTNGSSTSFSSHLSLQKLYTEFSHVDPEALKQEFSDSSFNYQETVIRLSNRYRREQGAPKTVIAPELLLHYEQDLILKAQQESLAQQELEETRVHQDEDDDDEFLPDDPQVYRDEAQTHYLQRKEFYRKAQEAHRQGMTAVAAYYAGIGKLHSDKLHEANLRASEKILEAVNSQTDANVLDLHLLHVPEALKAAQAFLSEREQLVAARRIHRMLVSIITGRGAHSIGGQARLKPAIKDFLQKKGYLFHEANSGMFVVTLQNK